MVHTQVDADFDSRYIEIDAIYSIALDIAFFSQDVSRKIGVHAVDPLFYQDRFNVVADATWDTMLDTLMLKQ